MEAYTKALEIRPFYADAYVGLGDAKAAQSDVDGAVTAYQNVADADACVTREAAALSALYEDVSRYPAIAEELARRGWSAEEIRKLQGENILRVLREAEAVARKLAK